MVLKQACWSIAILAASSFSCLAQADKTLNEQFKTTYYAYQDTLKTNDKDEQIKLAKKAYLLGSELYGESDINTANLALIVAQHELSNLNKKEAKRLLLTVLPIFEKKYAKNGIELSEIHLLLGNSQSSEDYKKSIEHYLKAIDIAKQHRADNPYYLAQIQLDAGIRLLDLKSKKSKVLLKAQAFFKNNLPANDKRVVRANFHVGKYYLMHKKYNKAADNLAANLSTFESLGGATHPLELNTHAFLIDAFEKAGKSEQATKHCIAIGAMKPWDDNQEQTPLFRVEPKYPKSYLSRRKSGWVEVGFTVSEAGTVTNAEVLKSHGGTGFEKSSLAAVEKWRYAPKFENGKPVTGYSTVKLSFLVK